VQQLAIPKKNRRVWKMSERSDEAAFPLGSGTEPGGTGSRILVDATWLSRHLDDPGIRILDVRPREQYDEGHIPGAVSAPIDLFKTERDGVPAMVIAREDLEELLERLGVSNDSTVVAYERTFGHDSARLFWTLEYYGHEDARVLDGGFLAWEEAGLPVVRGEPEVSPARYRAEPHPERLATWHDVQERIERPGATILDVRSRQEYTGEEVRPGTARGGRVPGAVHVEWTDALTAEEPRRMRAMAELQRLYSSAGVTPDREVVTYCRTGQRAAHTYFTLRLLGFPRVRMYDGSWAEWSNIPELPAEI
jgi:thiosulfate/3-mercaptopyruvate sulfurtransferase